MKADACRRAIDAFIELHNGPTFEPWDIVDQLRPPRRKKTKRRYSLKRAVSDARKMGVDVKVEADGAITLKCSQPTPDGSSNPWDSVLQ
jgi:hypothetical protein